MMGTKSSINTISSERRRNDSWKNGRCEVLPLARVEAIIIL